MNAMHNPKSIAAPLGRYSHGVRVPANAEWLYIAGQLGIAPDGTLAKGIQAQCEMAWRNVAAILADAGMGLEHLVKVNVYLTNPGDTGTSREVRDKVLAGVKNPPAATLVVITQLAKPEFLVEIEACAAKA